MMILEFYVREVGKVYVINLDGVCIDRTCIANYFRLNFIDVHFRMAFLAEDWKAFIDGGICLQARCDEGYNTILERIAV